MLDVVPFFKVGKCFDECRPVVCDNFTKCAPLEEDGDKNYMELKVYTGLTTSLNS